MQRVRLEYGDSNLDVDLPDDATVVRSGGAAHEPAGLATRSPTGPASRPEPAWAPSRLPRWSGPAPG